MIRYFSFAFIVALTCCRSVNKTQPHDLSTQCSDVPDDTGYRKNEILSRFGKVLSDLVPTYKRLDGNGFYVEGECQLTGAFIIDLSDTTNRETNLNECVKFLEGHVYHFAPIRENNSYSNIAILADGNVKVFKAINCPETGDKLNEVIEYVQKSGVKYDDPLLDRIKNYRKYGVYLKVDELSEFQCK